MKVLKELVILTVSIRGYVVILKELILHSLLWEDVVVMRELILTVSTLGGYGSLKRTDF